jgi:hypothetical protein
MSLTLEKLNRTNKTAGVVEITASEINLEEGIRTAASDEVVRFLLEFKEMSDKVHEFRKRWGKVYS